MDAIRSEMKSAKWTVLAIGYQCGFAYLTAFVCYQLGTLLSGGQVSALGIGIAVLILAAAVFLLVRKDPNEKRS